MVVARPKDAYDREVSTQEEIYIRGTALNLEDPLAVFKAFQVARELRNAAAAARKAIAKAYPEQYLTLVEKRLRKRGLSDESVITAMLTVKKSLRR